jgi:hypothetical protein
MTRIASGGHKVHIVTKLDHAVGQIGRVLVHAESR